VHEVEVKVVCPELLERVLEGHLDVLRVMVVLEELGGEPELLAGNTGSADTLADLALVLVAPSAAAASFSELLHVYGLEETYSMCRYPDCGVKDQRLMVNQEEGSHLDGVLDSLGDLAFPV